MLQDFIQKQLLDNFQHTPTADQSIVLKALAQFISSENEVLIIKGYAGTGKTTLVKTIVNTLKNIKIGSCLMAPTGRAAKVMSNYTKAPATTIHKKIFRQESISEANQSFTINYNKQANTIFIIDEASMLANNSNEKSVFGTGFLIDDIFSYIFSSRNCKLILIGDIAQLPPVGLVDSPALSQDFIQKTYLKDALEFTLKDIVRQSKNSGILAEATELRNLIENDTSRFPKIKSHADVICLLGNDLLEHLESSYNNYGVENTIVVTRSNKLANKYNEGIRNMILWKDSRISTGDYIMIVKNNYFWTDKNKAIDFIANGDIAEITRVNGYEDLYDFNFANVSIQFPDYEFEELDVKILLNTIDSESPALKYDDSLKFYNNIKEDYIDIKNKRVVYEKMKVNEHFNALQIKFAYAITCHKAQGGQWKHVYVDHGFLPEDSINVDFYRWLYTAITRATETVYLVNFKKELLQE